MSKEYKRKGIILAGGKGTRLYPITAGSSKQLVPIYDKPMIYYPLTTLMLADIKEFLVITTEQDNYQFRRLLGDGNQWGITIKYKIQEKPLGLAHAFVLAEDFLKSEPCVLILGDNLFHGDNLIPKLKSATIDFKYNTIFGYQVKDPERYGVINFQKDGRIISIEEKPKKPKSKFAMTGIYFFDGNVSKKAKQLVPSYRNELEITDLINSYLNEGLVKLDLMGRGIAWLDTGTPESLNDASSYVRTIENRQGLKIGCPEEIAFRKNWINKKNLLKISQKYKNAYGDYLNNLCNKIIKS